MTSTDARITNISQSLPYKMAENRWYEEIMSLSPHVYTTHNHLSYRFTDSRIIPYRTVAFRLVWMAAAVQSDELAIENKYVLKRYEVCDNKSTKWSSYPPLHSFTTCRSMHAICRICRYRLMAMDRASACALFFFPFLPSHSFLHLLLSYKPIPIPRTPPSFLPIRFWIFLFSSRSLYSLLFPIPPLPSGRAIAL